MLDFAEGRPWKAQRPPVGRTDRAPDYSGPTKDITPCFWRQAFWSPGLLGGAGEIQAHWVWGELVGSLAAPLPSYALQA